MWEYNNDASALSKEDDNYCGYESTFVLSVLTNTVD